MRLSDWGAALADVVLPARVNAGKPVVFACDDEAVRLAAQRAGVSNAGGVESLVEALQAEQPVSEDVGFAASVNAVRAFEAEATRPRGVPPYLVALAVTVIAASRMDRDERHATQAYYARLCEILHVERREEWPHVAGFDAFVDVGFRALAGWLSSDLGGDRGVLHLPAAPTPRVVGVPISQTPLRGRDRRLLGGFFYRHDAALRAGWSPLGLLRRWGGASRLTAPARALLEEPALAPQLEGALRAAFLSWDGTRLDETGARLLPSRLWLVPRPGTVWLRLETVGLDAPVSVVGPAGPMEVLPPPEGMNVPLEWLAHAQDGPVRFNVVGENARLPVFTGPTMLFEQHEGLEGVPVASEDPVWVLTADPALLEDDEREVTGGLPEPWRLIAAVDPSELSGELRVERPDDLERGTPVDLVGGLSLGAGVWLTGYPPVLVGDLPEPMIVEVDGRDAGELLPRRSFELPALGDGRHEVVCGDVEFEIELRDRGKREGVGSIRRRVGTQGEGATQQRHIDICGAEIVGGSGHPSDGRLLVRTRHPLEVLYEDGTVRLFAPPTDPEWKRAAGLAGAGRWEVENGNSVLAYAVSAPSFRQVVVLRTHDVSRTDAALDFAALHGDSPLLDRTPDRTGAAWWSSLLADLETADTDG